MEEELKDALRHLTPREAVKIKLDPLGCIKMAQAAARGEPTELSPQAVRYLNLLVAYIEQHGPDSVRDLASRWRLEMRRNC